MHPDNIFGQQHRRQGAGKAAVDAEITGESAPRKPDQRRPVVEQRPQHPVGVADVIFVEVAPRQIDDRRGDVAVDGQFWRFARALADRTAIPEPEAAGALQRSPQRDRQPALGRLVAADRAHSVRDDDQSARSCFCCGSMAPASGCMGFGVAHHRSDRRNLLAWHFRLTRHLWLKQCRASRVPRQVAGKCGAPASHSRAPRTEDSPNTAAVLPDWQPIRIDTPPRRLTSANPSSSVVSSPRYTGRRP